MAVRFYEHNEFIDIGLFLLATNVTVIMLKGPRSGVPSSRRNIPVLWPPLYRDVVPDHSIERPGVRITLMPSRVSLTEVHVRDVTRGKFMMFFIFLIQRYLSRF